MEFAIPFCNRLTTKHCLLLGSLNYELLLLNPYVFSEYSLCSTTYSNAFLSGIRQVLIDFSDAQRQRWTVSCLKGLGLSSLFLKIHTRPCWILSSSIIDVLPYYAAWEFCPKMPCIRMWRGGIWTAYWLLVKRVP